VKGDFASRISVQLSVRHQSFSAEISEAGQGRFRGLVRSDRNGWKARAVMCDQTKEMDAHRVLQVSSNTLRGDIPAHLPKSTSNIEPSSPF
jgi:hypothetical protein